jgi:hypothetical protein
VPRHVPEGLVVFEHLHLLSLGIEFQQDKTSFKQLGKSQLLAHASEHAGTCFRAHSSQNSMLVAPQTPQSSGSSSGSWVPDSRKPTKLPIGQVQGPRLAVSNSVPLKAGTVCFARQEQLYCAHKPGSCCSAAMKPHACPSTFLTDSGLSLGQG